MTSIARDGSPPVLPHFPAGLAAGLLAWGAAVALASEAGLFDAIVRASAPAYGGVIALGIAIPTLLYFFWQPMRRALDAIPLRTLTLFHIPRIAGGVLFLWYGWEGVLHPVFAALIGFGDIIAGLAALPALRGTPGAATLRRIHLTGLADFAVGLSFGMTLGILGDPRMIPMAAEPITQIVLWYVGMLATSHIVVLARLRREAGDAR